MSYEDLGKIIYPKPKYRTCLLKKRSGGMRVISEPRAAVKYLQYKLLEFVYEKSGEMEKCVHGFVKTRSIVTNAQKHCSPKTKFVFNIDLKDFFPSITFYRIRGMFRADPFNFGFQNATVLAQLCCHAGYLPQGAPTSPVLANLICRSLDNNLMALAYRNRSTYSRYCDDITFSFSVKSEERLPGGICRFDGSVAHVGKELIDLINTNGFQINPEKTRVSNREHRMEVTGLTINEFPNVKKRYVDSIRGALHAWEKYGYPAAQEQWGKIAKPKQHRVPLNPPLHRSLWGRLLFLKMVRSGDDLLYTRLAEKYNKLINNPASNAGVEKGSLLPISPVVRNSSDVGSSVFVVDCQGDTSSGEPVFSQGTAFAIGKHGLVTCDHVLRYAKPQITQNDGQLTSLEHAYFDALPGAVLNLVDARNGNRYEFKVLHRDPVKDLALLKFQMASLRLCGISPQSTYHWCETSKVTC